jgi:enoyl-CoA hydratase/carnithine racemase
MTTEFETVDVTFDESTGIGTLTLDRPDKLNAINATLRQEIKDGLQWLEAHNDDVDGVALRAVILDGAGGNFSVGGDVNDLSDDSVSSSSERHYRSVLLDFPVPLVAKIQGYCLGGGFEIAMSCDVRFAHEDSEMGLPEVNLGIKPGDGVQLLSRLTNTSVAKELALTGEHITARRAEELGIVNRVPDDIDAATQEFAETVASKPPLAVQAIKSAANMADEAGLRQGREYDFNLRIPLRQTEDYRKAKRAFNEEEYDPEYTGQ